MTGIPRPAARLKVNLALVLALTASGCSSTPTQGAPGSTTPATAPDSLPTTTTSPALPEPVFVEHPCTIETPSTNPVTCGSVTVPEDRSVPGGRQVQIEVAVVRSTAKVVSPDPVVYLHGGPGSGRLARGFERIASNPFLGTRDVVFFDQRGTGLSQPSLNCHERELAFVGSLMRAAPAAEEIDSIGDAIATCHARLSADGIDLSRYNTVENAEDLDAIRRALGYEQWNLWGVSYGTRLALQAMRGRTGGIRSVILDSVYPTTAGALDGAMRSGEDAFNRLADDCAADPRCDELYPELRETLEEAVLSLDADPYPFDFTTPDGSTTRLVVTGHDLIAGLFNALYDTTLIPEIPAAITAIARGERSIIPLIAKDGVPFVNNHTEGAYMSYECADNGARWDRDEASRLRANPGRAAVALASGWQIYCDRWPVTPLPASFGDIVRSEIPTLVIAGDYDPVTPADDSRRTAEALRRAVFVEVPRGGHAPTFDTPCTTQIALSFVDDPVAVDTTCATEMEPEPFS